LGRRQDLAVGTDIKAVVFDLDGTLIDSITPLYELVLKIFRDIGLPLPSRATINSILGDGLSIMESLVPRDIEDRASLIKRGREIGYRLWEKFQQEKLQPFPATQTILAELKHRGILRGIATSGEADYVEDLIRRGSLPRVEAVVTKEEVDRLKPAPDSILLCLSRLGCGPNQAVYVGDSPIDVQAGKAARVRTIAVLSGTGSEDKLLAEAPDLIIPEIGHLLEALEEL